MKKDLEKEMDVIESCSKFKGVRKIISPLDDTLLWEAFFEAKKRNYALGYYKTEEEAAQKYDDQAIGILHDHADLNFPERIKVLKTDTEEKFIIDASEYDFASQFTWELKNFSEGTSEICTNVDGVDLLYREIVLEIDEPYVMYLNKNTFDLRKANLVKYETEEELSKINKKISNFSYNQDRSISTQGQTRKVKASKYIGVTHHKQLLRSYCAQIRHAKKIYNLGYYYNEIHAALIYDKNALNLYGLSAKRNFLHLDINELNEAIKKYENEEQDLIGDHQSRDKQGKLQNLPYKSSIYVGVSIDKRATLYPWTASLAFRKKTYHLGKYATEREAALVYDNKVLELYGPEGKLNFPEIIGKIPLNFKETVIVDADDYHSAIRYKWTIKQLDHLEKVLVTDIDGLDVPFYKVILNFPCKYIYYKNENALDLRKENLAQYDTMEEFDEILAEIELDKLFKYRKDLMRGRQKISKRRCDKSKYSGVSYTNSKKLPWRSTLKDRDQLYKLGTFTCEETAALAYDKKALELFGPEAYVNFPKLTMEEIDEKLNKYYLEFPENKIIKNTTKGKPHSSIYQGVYFIQGKANSARPWSAAFYHDGKKVSLGYFISEEDAAIAIDKKRYELLGENTRFNFPEKINSYKKTLLSKNIVVERTEDDKKRLLEALRRKKG
jgi:hypothetical protein